MCYTNEARAPLPPELPKVRLAARKPTSRYLGIGKRLKEAREALKLSANKLAKCARISHTSIMLLESGDSIPLIPNIERIALALGVAPGWLAYGEGEGPPAAAPKARRG